MKFSTALIFATQLMSVLGGSDPADNTAAVCTGTQISGGGLAALCGTAVLATIFTGGVAGPSLVACGAAAAVVTGASTACKEIAIALDKRAASPKKSLNKTNVKGEPQVCFNVLLDNLGKRCFSSRDLVEIGGRMEGKTTCDNVGDTLCVKDKFFMTCGADKKWAINNLCRKGTKCKKSSKSTKKNKITECV